MITKLVTYQIDYGDDSGQSFTAPEGLTKAQIESITGRAIADAEYETLVTEQANAVTGFQTLPAFLKTMTADEAMTHIHSSVLDGKTEAQINTDIENLANSFAGMKNGLKTIGASLVAIRDILELIVKLLLFIRDLVIRYRMA
jgi:hypothetical protein